MTIRPITASDRKRFNAVVGHPLQSYEWGEFREKTGVKVIRRGLFEGNRLVSGFQLTIHKIPHISFTIGYLPKGELPTKEILEELKKIGRVEKCIFIQLEPNVRKSPPHPSPLPRGERERERVENLGLKPAAHPLFTKYTFVLDLTKPEEELLSNMHGKSRYNIKVAKKHGVEVVEDNSQTAFNEYLKLTEETTRRQKFFAHTSEYHRLMWNTLGVGISSSSDPPTGGESRSSRQARTINNKLTAHLLVAKYKRKILTAWILFVFKDTLYYPYGASSSENREVMASSLVMWEAIKYGKKLGLKHFDMWGALGPNPDQKDPWFGFHNFKEKYGPEHVEFIGSYDLVINPVLYQAYKLADKLRWAVLRIKK